MHESSSHVFLICNVHKKIKNLLTTHSHFSSDNDSSWPGHPWYYWLSPTQADLQLCGQWVHWHLVFGNISTFQIYISLHENIFLSENEWHEVKLTFSCKDVDVNWTPDSNLLTNLSRTRHNCTSLTQVEKLFSYYPAILLHGFVLVNQARLEWHTAKQPRLRTFEKTSGVTSGGALKK